MFHDRVENANFYQTKKFDFHIVWVHDSSYYRDENKSQAIGERPRGYLLRALHKFIAILV